MPKKHYFLVGNDIVEHDESTLPYEMLMSPKPISSVILDKRTIKIYDKYEEDNYYKIGAQFTEPRIVNLLDKKEIDKIDTQLNLNNNDKEMLLYILRICNARTISQEEICQRLEIVPQEFLYKMLPHSQRIQSWYNKNYEYDVSGLETIQNTLSEVTTIGELEMKSDDLNIET